MILLEEIIAVLIGGAIGSLLRFVISRWINEIMPKNFPWGILFVNILGCLLIGLLAGLLMGRDILNPFWRTGIFIGLLGGFTTFSSFSLDSINLLQSGAYLSATTNIVASLIFSLVATMIGLVIAKAIVS